MRDNSVRRYEGRPAVRSHPGHQIGYPHGPGADRRSPQKSPTNRLFLLTGRALDVTLPAIGTQPVILASRSVSAMRSAPVGLALQIEPGGPAVSADTRTARFFVSGDWGRAHECRLTQASVAAWKRADAAWRTTTITSHDRVPPPAAIVRAAPILGKDCPTFTAAHADVRPGSMSTPRTMLTRAAQAAFVGY